MWTVPLSSDFYNYELSTGFVIAFYRKNDIFIGKLKQFQNSQFMQFFKFLFADQKLKFQDNR